MMMTVMWGTADDNDVTVFKIKKLSFSFQTAKDLWLHVETLPAGPK